LTYLRRRLQALVVQTVGFKQDFFSQVGNDAGRSGSHGIQAHRSGKFSPQVQAEMATTIDDPRHIVTASHRRLETAAELNPPDPVLSAGKPGIPRRTGWFDMRTKKRPPRSSLFLAT